MKPAIASICLAGLASVLHLAPVRGADPVPPVPPPPMLLCAGYKPHSYQPLKGSGYTWEIQVVEKYGVTPWFTASRDQAGASKSALQMITCGDDRRIPMVVIGMPLVQCETQLNDISTGMYYLGINSLAGNFSAKPMLYVMEPGALGQILGSKCIDKTKEPLVKAMKKLTENPKADVYLDVAYSTLTNPTERTAAANLIKSMADVRIKGFALNTGGYEKTEDMEKHCNDFIAAVDSSKGYKCVIDTSRNFNGAPNHEMCNYDKGGIGELPQIVQKNNNVEYYMWNKPPGESDGPCTGVSGAMVDGAPPAGAFFMNHFTQLWKNGYFGTKKVFTFKETQPHVKGIKCFNTEMCTAK